MNDTRSSYTGRLSSFWRPDQLQAIQQPSTTPTTRTPLLHNSGHTSRSSTGSTSSAHSATFTTPTPQAELPTNGTSVNVPNRQASSSHTMPSLSLHEPSRPMKNAMTRTPTAQPKASSPATTPAIITLTASATPMFSRPLLQRSATTTTAVPHAHLQGASTSTAATRPSLLRRATDIVNSTLELDPTKSRAYRKAPPKPSHWTDHAHRDALVKIWDYIHATAASPRYPKSTTAQLVSTEKQMLLAYGELGEGETPLSREWVEYVLGVCLRHPFCTAETMGRFEVLSASGGARGNWGPW